MKSYHIDSLLSFKVFDMPRITFIIKGRKRLFPKQKTTCLLITKHILGKITANKPVNIAKLNINTAFKFASANFLCLEKITYMGSKLKKASFLSIKVTRSNISFAKGNQYTVLYLKQNRTIIVYTKV